MKNYTFEIKYGDFGQVHIIATTFSEVEHLFLQAKYGGEKVEIKSIIRLYDTNEPLYHKKRPK
jgi:hypothetical protein